MNDEAYPALYRAADLAAVKAQKRYVLLLKSYCTLLILAACLSLYGIENEYAAIVAAIIIGASAALSAIMLAKKNEDTWYRARAVAESVKTSTWRFMMRSEPYLDAPSVGEAKTQFLSLLKKILGEHEDLSYHLSGKLSEANQLTNVMCDIRRHDVQKRKEYYRENRIDEQRSWYAHKAEYNSRRNRLWYGLMFACQGIALLFVVLRIVNPDWKYWPVELFLVGAGVALAWIQAKRFRELASAYGLAAQEIGIIRSQLDDITLEDEFAQFVADSENAFSREHTQWLARRDSF